MQLAKARPRQMSPVAQAAEMATKAATDEHPIGYLPGLFAQHCIFPQKRLPSEQRRWTIHTHKKRIELQSGSYLLPGLAEQWPRNSVRDHAEVDSAVHHQAGTVRSPQSDIG